MRRHRRDRGSVIEFLPALVIGVLLILGTLQIALFMAGRHTTELAAFRAGRVLEAKRGDSTGASTEAARITRLGYPERHSGTTTVVRGSKATVRLEMRSILPFPAKSITVRAQHPPRLVPGGWR